MKKSDEIIRFIINIIFGNIFKLIIAFAILSVLLCFTIILGPLLGASIGIFFILIFGDGPYLNGIMYLSTIGMFLIYTYLTITLVWSDEIEEYKTKKEQKKRQEFVNDTKNIIEEMKQNAKMQGRENDDDVKNIIKGFEDTIADELDKEKYLAQLRKDLAKIKQEADLNDKNVQENIKFMEKEIKNIENGTDTMY